MQPINQVMKVNLYKLIRMLLPTFLRSNKISELIRAILLQLEYSLNLFNRKVPDWKYRSNTNASVIALEHHIKRELDVDAIITELEGKPIDFLVTVNGFVDENRLRSLIENYKLGGKSYVFQVGNEEFTAEFTNFVCESYYTDNLITLNDWVTDKKLKVLSEVAVKSDIIVKLRVLYTVGSSYNQQDYQLTIPVDDTESLFADINSGTTVIEILSVTPISDNYFNYKFI